MKYDIMFYYFVADNSKKNVGIQKKKETRTRPL